MLKKALQKVVSALDKLGAPYALVGGLALAARGVVRATRDIDILVDWDVREGRAFAAALKANKLAATFHQGAPDDPVRGLIRLTLRGRAGPLKCDVLFTSAPWQAQAVQQASRVKMEGYRLRIVQAVDLFLLKLQAAGPMDLLDAARLLQLQTEQTRRVWKARAAGISESKAFAKCFKLLRDID